MDLQELKHFCLQKKYPIIRNEAANLLCKLVSEKNPREILEIGLCAGYSASLLLSCCNGNLTSIEIDENRFIEAKENLKNMGFSSSRYNLILGDACEILPKFSKNFDFVFLDGPKGQYANLLPYILDLLQENGILVADNIGYFGKVASCDYSKKHRSAVKNLQSFLTALKQNSNLETRFFDIDDGICVATKGIFTNGF